MSQKRDLDDTKNFDKSGGLDKLMFDMTKSLDTFRLKWKTLDMVKIEEIMRICLVRELQQIEERKDAFAFQIRYDKRLLAEAAEEEAKDLTGV